jgi:putative phosphoesterase
MKTVAALYDIHGNLPALEAVLAEVAAWAPELILVGGDVVPGPMPEACFEALATAAAPVRWIRGNGDVGVVATARGAPPSHVPEAFHPVMRWVAGRTSEARLEDMAGWPLSVTLSVGGIGEVLFCHATPRNEDEIFTVNTPDISLHDAFAGVAADVVVCGHTHMPFDRLVNGTRVVNAGSVGMPFGDLQAQWLALGPDGVRPRRVRYDLAGAATRIAATGYPIPMDLANPPDAGAMLASFDKATEAGSVHEA